MFTSVQQTTTFNVNLEHAECPRISSCQPVLCWSLADADLAVRCSCLRLILQFADTFDSVWLIEGAGTRFPHILAFCGADSTVESDFSIIVCGKCLTDLSFEGFVHCKQ
jgi:hypothetical protein